MKSEKKKTARTWIDGGSAATFYGSGESVAEVAKALLKATRRVSPDATCLLLDVSFDGESFSGMATVAD